MSPPHYTRSTRGFNCTISHSHSTLDVGYCHIELLERRKTARLHILMHFLVKFEGSFAMSHFETPVAMIREAIYYPPVDEMLTTSWFYGRPHI